MSASIFSYENDYYDITIKDDKKKFVCKHLYCGKVFNYESEMKRHVTIHSPSRPFTCPYANCIKTFKRSDALDNHVRCSHKKETAYVCPFSDCEMAFTAHGSFRHHVQKNHKNTSEESSSTDEPSPIVKKMKLESEKGNPFLDQRIKKIDSSNQSEISPKTNFFVSASGASEINMMNQIEEENIMLKEKLTSNEKAIKGLQEKINDLLNRFYTFQTELETKTEKTAFTGLPEFTEISFQEHLFNGFETNKGNLFDLECDAFPIFGEVFEYEKNC